MAQQWGHRHDDNRLYPKSTPIGIGNVLCSHCGKYHKPGSNIFMRHNSKLGARNSVNSSTISTPKYVHKVVTEYSGTGIGMYDGHQSYVWTPLQNNPKYNERKAEIFDNAWVKYKNRPSQDTMAKLVKHAESTTGKLKQICDLHFAWSCSKLGASIPFSGGVPYPKVPEHMSFEDWYYTGEVTIYRGVRGKYTKGSADKTESWSFSRPIAESFANFDRTMPSRMWGPADEWKGEKHVLQGVVHPYQIIAYEDDNEAEVIVRTGDVKIQEV